ncbi:MAG: hypothetical protein ACOYT4_02420 [Nanoarchaeota archaeon]
MIKRVKAPIRIDFGGGTTDIYPFTKIEGGAVLNCAINHYVIGELVATDKETKLEYHADIPTSSGLGTSGVMNLVWLALISKTNNKIELAENVYKLEQSQGLVGGKQDQYAAALGGINFLEFKNDKVKINHLNLDKKFLNKLENSLVIVYLGEHFSGSANKLMIDNLIKGKNRQNLINIKKIAIEMKNALSKKNLERFSELLNSETEERKKLHKDIVNPKMEKFIKEGFENGAISAKICGSGGGGSILFFCKDRKKLISKFKSNVIEFKIDFNGLTYF